MNDNVIATPTKANGDQGWQCKVCKEEVSYAQPINLREQLMTLGAFIMQHDHKELLPVKKESWHRWIKCSEHLPSDNRTVKVRDGLGLEMWATYDQFDKKWRFNEKHALGEIVEWREQASK